MRVTMGRYSSEGVVPCNIKHDTAGPMASTVADLAVLDAVIMGAAHSDYTPADLKGLTVAFPPDFSSKDLAPGNAKAIALDGNLGGAQNMAGGVKPHSHIPDPDLRAQTGGLSGAGMVSAIADRHDVEGFRRRQHVAVAGAGMVGVAVGDQRPVDIAHRINEKTAWRTVKPLAARDQQVFRFHCHRS